MYINTVVSFAFLASFSLSPSLHKGPNERYNLRPKINTGEKYGFYYSSFLTKTESNTKTSKKNMTWWGVTTTHIPRRAKKHNEETQKCTSTVAHIVANTSPNTIGMLLKHRKKAILI